MIDRSSHQLYDEAYFQAREGAQQRDQMYRQEYARLRSITGLEGGAVLDIGCGTGAFLDLFPGSCWTKYGIEVSPYAMDAARLKGIRFDLPAQPECFDLIVLRGTIQHLDRPVDMLHRSLSWLKKGGWICFLATPNAGSVVYRLFQDLPALDPPRNFVIFSAKTLRQCLINVGFREISFVYPYLSTPYASPVRDHLCFLLRCLGVKVDFAFWGNMMECYARK